MLRSLVGSEMCIRDRACTWDQGIWPLSSLPQTRRFLGGRQPLCGIGVTSSMLVTLRPAEFNARTADSRPGPGPRTRTSTDLTPYSWAAVPARSAATCAANGVLLREPRKPQPPDVAH